MSRLLCLLLFTWSGSLSQPVQSSQFELSLPESDAANFRVVGAGKTGLVVYRHAIASDGREGVDVIRLDSMVRQVWKGFIPLDRNFFILEEYVYGNHLFLLTQPQFEFSRQFQLVSVDLSDKQFQIFNVGNNIPITVRYFLVTDKAVWIGGYFNYRPIALHFSFATHQARVLPGIYNATGEIVQLTTDAAGNAHIMVTTKNDEAHLALVSRSFDPDGNLAKTEALQPADGKDLLFGQSIQGANGSLVVAGVFGQGQRFSRGIFLSRLSSRGDAQTSYYNFDDLDHFFNYLTASREKRIRERIERKKVKGKKIRLRYRFLVHGLIPVNGSFLLVGEAFYPIYQGSGDINAHTYRPYEYYRYTHAIVIGFRPDGKVLWDNSFEIPPVNSFDLKQFIKLSVKGNQVVLLYLFHNKLVSKIISAGAMSDGVAVADLEKNPDNRYSGIEWDELDYWYNDNFYTFGVRRDASMNFQVAGRKVFFINKFTYR